MSSLFQLKKFWYTSFPGEEFSSSALTCGNLLNEVDNNGNEVNLLAIGSFQGHLRVWQPSDKRGAAQPEDVLFEATYNEPILQIQCDLYQPLPQRNDAADEAAAQQPIICVGARTETVSSYSPSSTINSSSTAAPPRRSMGKPAQNLLAVLFARRLMLLRLERDAAVDDAHGTPGRDSQGGTDGEAYSLQTPQENVTDAKTAAHYAPVTAGAGCGGGSMHVRQRNCICTTYYEVDLERPMYNFTSGDLGKEKYHKICAQSMDGHLFIIDHNKILYRCVLPAHEFVLPGCLACCSLADSILTVNSSHVLLCYSLASIADASGYYVEPDTNDSVEHGKDSFLISPSSLAAVGSSAAGMPALTDNPVDVCMPMTRAITLPIRSTMSLSTLGERGSSTSIRIHNHGASPQLADCSPPPTVASSQSNQPTDRLNDTRHAAAAAAAASLGSTLAQSNLCASWTYDIAEEVIAMEVCTVTRGLSWDDTDIVVLCPYALHIISMHGSQRIMRMLDVEASCLCGYALSGGTAVHNVLVGTYQGSLYVYEDVTTSWCAKLTSTSSSPTGNIDAPPDDDNKDVHALQVLVGRLCGVSGMMVVLDSAGTLSIDYLGTDSAAANATTRIATSQTYDEMVVELQAIQRELSSVGVAHAASTSQSRIMECSNTSFRMDRDQASAAPRSITVPSAAVTHVSGESDPAVGSAMCKELSSHVVLSAQNIFTPVRYSNDDEADETASRNVGMAGDAMCAKSFSVLTQISVSVRSSHGVLDEVVLQLESTEPITIEPRQVEIARVTDDCVTEMVFTCRIECVPGSVPLFDSTTTPAAARAKGCLFISSLEVTVLALYRSTASCPATHSIRPEMRVMSARLHHTLPLSFVAQTIAASPPSTFSLQLNTSQSTPHSLIDLFADMALLPESVMHPNTLSFRFVDGTTARLLVSKNAARFKLQAASMEKVWLLASELIRRLRGRDGHALHISIQGEIPLCLFVLLIQRYRQPIPCDASTATVSEHVLAASCALLQKCTLRVEHSCVAHKEACAQLGAGAQLLGLYLDIQYADALNAHPRDRTLLQGLLRCDVTDGTASVSGTSWEEMVEETLLRAMNMTSSALPLLLPTARSHLLTGVSAEGEEIQGERVGTGGSIAQLQICLQNVIVRLSNMESIVQ